MAEPDQQTQNNQRQPKRNEIKPYKYGTEFNNKLVSMGELDRLLRSNVCIISFVRKHPVSGRNAIRRMLCTNSVDLLGSYNGRVKLSYRPPSQPPPYNPANYGLVCAWDILMIDYRMINAQKCYLNYQYPVTLKEERNMFWRELFNKTFYLMSSKEKEGWMWYW